RRSPPNGLRDLCTGALERFLRFFDVPVLCMTASLPMDRRDTLVRACSLQMYPSDPESFPDLRRQAAHKRYQISLIEEPHAEQIAVDALIGGKKVLWVVNTVGRCQTIARRLVQSSAPAGGSLFCYHSRFSRSDRRDRHEEVVRVFRRDQKQSALAVTTQVCEMSLDLDADVLITEYAPVPSLIQRMGRCCREPDPLLGRMGLVYAYKPESERPYQAEKGAIEKGERFLRELAQKGAVCHADLSDYLQQMPVTEPFIEEGYSSFLDSGWAAGSKQQDFREGDEFTVDCVLDRDVEAYLEVKRRRGVTDGFIVPIPKRFARFNEKLGRFLREAPASQYSSDFGFYVLAIPEGIFPRFSGHIIRQCCCSYCSGER
ncbi:MAG TPA: CRISPR-associated helicase Cas3', partial [Candidatus Binatia bacterium]|nr:CRISPR-associated helicase Cas3' [Candidatus Binatia bacterium]